MELRQALKEQYHAGLAMLAECVEKCPEDVWRSGEHERPFWGIAFHAVFYTHQYLVQNEAAFQPWPGQRENRLPEGDDFYQRTEILDYIRFVDELIDPTVD